MMLCEDDVNQSDNICTAVLNINNTEYTMVNEGTEISGYNEDKYICKIS